MASESTEHQLGRLDEGQRQNTQRMDRMDHRTDRLEGKLDKLIWIGLGLLVSLLGVLAATLVGIVAD
jgi:hypothetical protein